MTTKVIIEYANHPVRIGTYDPDTGMQVNPPVILTEGRYEVYVHAHHAVNVEEIHTDGEA
jgi:hypothetical protein